MAVLEAWVDMERRERAFLEAVNYETVLRAVRCSDARASAFFRRLRSWCDTSRPISENIEAYKFIACATEKELLDAQSQVLKSFESLPDDAGIITDTDPEWPVGVKNVMFLYFRGDVSLLGKPSVAVVGTRRPTDKALENARKIVDSLGEGYAIVSGLARGIDGVAHIEALSRLYGTVAVLGTPVDAYYPAEHRALQDMIAEKGLLVSEFGPGRVVQQYFFIQRNETISSISEASFVVESSDGGGGVREARYAEAQGKDVLVLREVYENQSLRWPREIRSVVVVPSPEDALQCVRNSEPYRDRKSSIDASLIKENAS